jgi:hypothetical protein
MNVCFIYKLGAISKPGTKKITTIPIAINNLKAPYRFDPHPKVVILPKRRDIFTALLWLSGAMMDCV